MTLTLRIENFDKLEDGGPLWLTLEGRGASVGRKASMDWTLPDPARHISSHHFDVTFENGQYFVADVSTNGTFLQGQSHRLQGKHPLSAGERLVVGHYVIAVELGMGTADAPQVAPAEAAPAYAPPPPAEADPWDFGGGSLDPVNPLPAARNAHHLDDVAQDFVPLQQAPAAPIAPTPPVHTPEYGHVAAAPQMQPQVPPAGYAADGGPLPQVPPAALPQDGGPMPQVPPAMMPAAAPPPGAVPMPAPVPTPAPTPAAAPGSPVPPQAPAPQPQPAPGSGTGGNVAIIRAFCEGAGLDPSRASVDDPEAFARELGSAMRTVTAEVMQMLNDRANVKQFTKGGARTMRAASDNNPMKFLPDTGEALEALFTKPRDGFQTGAAGYANALGDLRQHQMAVFAALQPALAQVLDGLSPDEIEEAAASTAKLGPSRRGRNWDYFVELWDKKAEAGEHGMLDAFLEAFAKSYIAAGGGSNM